jgi:tetratricopeptide (TPR) repeat protein
VNNKEVTLLAEKVDALIKSNKYDEAKEVVDTVIELAPSTAKYYLKKAEIYSLEEDVIEVEKMLMEARKYIWRSNEYAALLSYFSWIASIREDYIKSLYYAGASCLYNNALQVKNFANNVLTRAIEATGDTSLEVPNKEKVLAYFEEDEEIYPTKQNNIKVTLKDFPRNSTINVYDKQSKNSTNNSTKNANNQNNSKNSYKDNSKDSYKDSSKNSTNNCR